MKKTLVILCLLSAIISCVSSKITRNKSISSYNPSEYTLDIPTGLIEPDIPIDNPLTKEKIKLGKLLFFDARLSIDNSVSCGSCHNPEYGFAENKSLTIRPRGVVNIFSIRNSSSIINSGFQETLTWNGKFQSLEDQVAGSFSPYGDMGIDIGEALEKISGDSLYKELSLKAFNEDLTSDGLKKAIAAFERSTVSGNTRFDRYLYKKEADQLNADEIRGFELFIGKASCITCHDIFHESVNSLGGGIALFTDHRFHNLGVGYINNKMEDVGRFEVTRNYEDWGAFKTPSLRNVELTAPYMHNGSLLTLEDVVDLYNKGGIANPNLSPGIKPLFLTRSEQADIVSFLKSLTDTAFTKKRTEVLSKGLAKSLNPVKLK